MTSFPQGSGNGHYFPYSGQIAFRGDIADSKYDVAMDAFVITYLGESFNYHTVDVHHNSALFEHTVSNWLDRVYQQHQKKGQSNVSRQSNANASSGSSGAQSGATWGNSGGLTQNLLAQAHQAALQQAATQHYIVGGGGGFGSITPITFGAQDCGKPAALKSGDIRLGEIIGWRGWRVTADGLLRSMSVDVLWAPGEPMKGDVKGGADHCGIYSYKSGSDFLKKHRYDLDVIGRVAMWGRVIEHELGYRAEFAKIIALEAMLDGAPERPERKSSLTLEQLRNRYGVAAAA